MDNKKVVVLGGGTGQSRLLKGLKRFPLDISAVVSVSDNGRSTGRLREEFGIPAVGDIRRVLISLSETEPLVEKLFNYKFNTTSDLDGQAVGNLILTATKEITGNLSDGIEALSKVFNLKGKVLPLTEDNVTLAALMSDDTVIYGEEEITLSRKHIEKIFYKENVTINPDVINAIKESDAIILSMGSVYTSVIPNLINKEVIDAIDKSNAKIIYVCNMFTQPGETDNFTVSDHIKLFNGYLGKKKIDTVIANNKKVDEFILKKYQTEEQKDQVVIDYDNLENIKLVEGDYFTIDNNIARHDELKLSLSIFTELY